ncbi:MAG: prolyl oligopeptidase family serine peptidase, partial [Steroidobacteraceae bacterium]
MLKANVWLLCVALMVPTLLPAQSSVGTALAAAQSGVEQPVKPALKPLDVFDLQWAADPQISPDGRSIAYVRMSMDIKTDARQGVIWLTSVDGKHTRPLSAADHSSRPRWSPDSTRIAYSGAASDGSNQLFMYWSDSNVTAAISHFTESPTSLSWSPDGRWLAFTMPVRAEHKSLRVELPAAPKDAHWAEPPKLIDRLVFRRNGRGYLPNSFSQLFVMPADGDAARQLTHGDFDHDGTPAWSADGKSVLIAANRHADGDYEPLDNEVYRVDLADGSIHALTDRRGPDYDPMISPDGKHIAYLGFDDRHLAYQVTQLYVMDSDGTRARSLTPSLDRDAAAPRWSGDGRQVFFQYDDHGTVKLAAVDLSGKMRVLATDLGGANIARPDAGGSFSVAVNGRFAYTQGAASLPAQLATGTSARDIRTLTDLSGSLLSERTLGQVEEITFESSADSRKVQGWIIKPPNFNPAVKYPLLLQIHGGPFDAVGPSFAAELQLCAAAGYVVLYLNPRGSTSYGEEFADLINHDMPGKDFDDLMSGVDAAIKQGYVDPKRLFVT